MRKLSCLAVDTVDRNVVLRFQPIYYSLTTFVPDIVILLTLSRRTHQINSVHRSTVRIKRLLRLPPLQHFFHSIVLFTATSSVAHSIHSHDTVVVRLDFVR